MKRFIFAVLFFITVLIFPTQNVRAEELEAQIASSSEISKSKLTDASHYTYVTLNKDDTITVTSKNGALIYGFYISWETEPAPWIMTTDSGDISCGLNGFIHEYIALDSPSASVTVHIPENSVKVDQIRIFGEGELPHDVQVWNLPCERADIMVVSSHADDEHLFLGGAMPLYAYEYDAAVQVVYMCEFRTTGQSVREHEKLDGLWEAGIRNYPVCGNFWDVYSETTEKARTQYDYDEMVKFLVEQIRSFRPQVVVTHDIYGEYGHGYHKLTAHAVLQAVELAAMEDQYTDSVAAYSTWNTPKTYLHISEINPITLDLRVVIEEDYAQRTALDILKAAYKKHVSQQYAWFYVSDTYEYSCADFGLVRSLVGADTTNDLLCNLKTYAVQEVEEQVRLEAEAAAQKAEAERLEAERKAEEERLAKEEQARLEAEQKAEEERLAKEEQARQEIIQKAEEEKAAIKSEQENLRATEAAGYTAEIESLNNELASAKQSSKLLLGGMLVLLLALAGCVAALILARRK